MKTKGSFEYEQDSAERVYKLVNHIPRTTNAITLLARKKYFKRIHPKTVKRLLTILMEKGRIKRFVAGRTTVWQGEREQNDKKKRVNNGTNSM